MRAAKLTALSAIFLTGCVASILAPPEESVGPAALASCMEDPEIMRAYRATYVIGSKALVASVMNDSPQVYCYWGELLLPSDPTIQCIETRDICTILMWSNQVTFIPSGSDLGRQVMNNYLGADLIMRIQNWETRFANVQRNEPVAVPTPPGAPQRGRAAGAGVAGSDR